jgi:2-polyprenyl-3-methyl-5-hydroxy-6-metoxy-1,4-benzoquinol methylase
VKPSVFDSQPGSSNASPVYDHSRTYTELTLRSIPHRMRLRSIERAVRDLDLPQAPSLADLGCGNGFITDRLARQIGAVEVCGYDVTGGQLEEGQRRYPHIRFVKADLNQPPQETRLPRFDLVTCFETLEHVGNPSALLSNLVSALKPTGIGLLTMPIEVGLIGVAKFVAKTLIAAAPPRSVAVTSELSQSPGTWARYATALTLGGDITRFRDQRARWGTHLGFDWRRTAESLARLGVEFEGRTIGTTRLYRLRVSS